MATKQNFEKLLNAPNVRKMLDLIANAEGVKHGYNTLFGNEKFNDLSQHPNVSKAFTQTDGKKNTTTAAGRYQFLKGTWDGLAKKLGLDDFSPKNQDIAAVALLAQNGALPHVLKGDFKLAVQKSGRTWASLPSAPERYSQPKKSWEDIGIRSDSTNNNADLNESTYSRLKKQLSQTIAPTIEKVYEAYQNGSLSEKAKRDFETDVNSGAIMLPRGASLKTKKGSDAVLLSQDIADAYAANELSPHARRELEDHLKAGLVKLPLATQNKSSLPDFDQSGVLAQQPTEQGILPPLAPDPTLLDKAMGVGDAALTGLSAATTGALGYLGGTAHGLADTIAKGQFGTQEGARNIAGFAQRGSEAGTRMPTTQTGQNILEAAEDVIGALPPTLGGGIGMQAAALGRAAVPQGVVMAQQAAQAAAPVVERAGQAIQRPIQATANAARSGVESVRDMVGMGRGAEDALAPANIGAAQVDQATVRQALAQDLPYPPRLTEGQLSRDSGQLKFEIETAKDTDIGAPIRQRYEEQHQVMQQNIDAFIDQTGASATNMREAGISVDKALQKQMNADRNRVRAAYAKADKSDEAKKQVDLSQPVRVGDESMSVIDYLNSQPELPTTPILMAAKRTAEALGIARRGENGELIPNQPSIKQMEKWRQQINDNTNQEAPNIRQTAILKNMIDEHVGPVEGQLYKAARMERKRFADRFENHTIIKDLTSNKANTDDRKVALENIQKRIIHDGSLDDMRIAKRTLLTSGDEGKQAWRDIQGQTLQELKDAATAGVSPDSQGNQMISPAALNKAIKKLDDAGKLDFIFGQQGAEKLRALNEISKTLFTAPASAAINHSNTAATLAAAMDIAISGLSGFPAPVASALRLSTKHIKDKKVRARVQRALNPQRTP